MSTLDEITEAWQREGLSPTWEQLQAAQHWGRSMKALELEDYCESLAREIDHSHLTHDLIAAAAELRRLAAVEAERDGLRAARIAYASEFPPIPDGDDAGLPAVGSIHENIRRLKAELERIKALEPAAVRYDFDGHGWQYIDSGSGSDWLTRHKDGEVLYTLGCKT